MNTKKAKAQAILAISGVALFIAGVVLALLFADAQGILKTMPFICVGIGAGLCGGGLSGILTRRHLQKNPQLAKQAEIDKNDERNIAISIKAKAAAYNFTLLIFSALIIFLAVAQVETYITLVFVGAYVLVVFLQIYFLNKYHKEM